MASSEAQPTKKPAKKLRASSGTDNLDSKTSSGGSKSKPGPKTKTRNGGTSTTQIKVAAKTAAKADSYKTAYANGAVPAEHSQTVTDTRSTGSSSLSIYIP